MNIDITRQAEEVLHFLIGQPLLYAIKSPDTQLYDFGFGKAINKTNCFGESKTVGTYTLHVVCRFRVIWKNSGHGVDTYDEYTSYQQFFAKAQQLLGQQVIRIALSEKNDLWLDFGEYWIVFATFENSRESWRFFGCESAFPHLVVSNMWIEFS